MDRITPEGCWTAPPGQFAARIRAGELPGVLSKNLLVDLGARAVLVEDGQIVGELLPGRHTLDSLAERLTFGPRPQTSVVVVREEEVPVEIETVLSAQDGRTMRVGLRVHVQAEDVFLFVENVLGARESLALDELRSSLTPVLTEQLREAVGRCTLEELVQAGAPRRLAAALGDGSETLHHFGFRLGPIVTITIRPLEPPAEAASVSVPEATSESQPSIEPRSRLRRSGRRTICRAEAGPGLAFHAGDHTSAETEAMAADGEEGRVPSADCIAAASVLVNSLGMKLALITPGRFLMGSPPEEPERGGAEDQHLVEIPRVFHLGVFPVTQDEYRRTMGTDPSCFAEPEPAETAEGPRGRLPVERVSWEDAGEFCRRLSELPDERAAGRLYRLPTEAEWEYACRAGAASAYAFGPSLSPAEANFDGRSLLAGNGTPGFLGSTTPVGSYPPNAWGLHDVHGNLWEWCADWFSPDYYRQSPSRDPAGPATGFARVLRGGSWRSRPAQCRSAARYSATPTHRHDAFGFRVVCTAISASPMCPL